MITSARCALDYLYASQQCVQSFQGNGWDNRMGRFGRRAGPALPAGCVGQRTAMQSNYSAVASPVPAPGLQERRKSGHPDHSTDGHRDPPNSRLAALVRLWKHQLVVPQILLKGVAPAKLIAYV